MKNVTLIVLGMLLYSGPGSDARLHAQTKPAAALSQTDTQRLLNCLQKGCGDAARMLRDAHTLKINREWPPRRGEAQCGGADSD